MTDGSSGDAHLSYVQIFNVNSTARQQGGGGGGGGVKGTVLRYSKR